MHGRIQDGGLRVYSDSKTYQQRKKVGKKTNKSTDRSRHSYMFVVTFPREARSCVVLLEKHAWLGISAVASPEHNYVYGKEIWKNSWLLSMRSACT